MISKSSFFSMVPLSLTSRVSNKMSKAFADNELSPKFLIAFSSLSRMSLVA